MSDETFGGLPVTVELDGEEDELVPPPGLGAGADLAPPDDNGFRRGARAGSAGADGRDESRGHWPYHAGCGVCVQGERLLDGFGMMLNQKALELTFSSLGMESTGRCSSS